MNLGKKSKELVSEIKKTREYTEFKKAKSNVEKYKDLKAEMEKFQKNQLALFSTKKSKQEIEYLTRELDKKFKHLSTLPEVKKLIKSKKDFDEMMFKLYKSINDELDSELKS